MGKGGEGAYSLWHMHRQLQESELRWTHTLKAMAVCACHSFPPPLVLHLGDASSFFYSFFFCWCLILILAPSLCPSSSLPSPSCLHLQTFTQWLLLTVSLSVPGGGLLEALKQIQRLAPHPQDLLQNFPAGRRLQPLVFDNEGGPKGLRWG